MFQKKQYRFLLTFCSLVIFFCFIYIHKLPPAQAACVKNGDDCVLTQMQDCCSGSCQKTSNRTVLYNGVNIAGICVEPTPTPKPIATPIPPNPCPAQKGICTNITTALGPIDVTNPGAFIKTLFSLLLSFSGGIALILIIISGYRILTSQGDPEKLKGAREMLTSAIIGLLFMIFSVTILQILGVDILHIPGFNR